MTDEEGAQLKLEVQEKTGGTTAAIPTTSTAVALSADVILR